MEVFLEKITTFGKKTSIFSKKTLMFQTEDGSLFSKFLHLFWNKQSVFDKVIHRLNFYFNISLIASVISLSVFSIA